MEYISRKAMFVSAGGGVLDYVSPEGEVLRSVAIPAGSVPALQYVALCPPGAQMQPDGFEVVNPPSAAGIQRYGAGSHDTGANPDFRPLGNAEKLQREMLLTMRKMQASAARLEAREKALSSIERVPPAPVESVPPAPAPAASEVIETE